MLPANCKPWAEKDWHALSAAHGQVGVTVGLNPETGNSTRGFIRLVGYVKVLNLTNFILPFCEVRYVSIRVAVLIHFRICSRTWVGWLLTSAHHHLTISSILMLRLPVETIEHIASLADRTERQMYLSAHMIAPKFWSFLSYRLRATCSTLHTTVQARSTINLQSSSKAEEFSVLVKNFFITFPFSNGFANTDCVEFNFNIRGMSTAQLRDLQPSLLSLPLLKAIHVVVPMGWGDSWSRVTHFIPSSIERLSLRGFTDVRSRSIIATVAQIADSSSNLRMHSPLVSAWTVCFPVGPFKNIQILDISA